jgi:predicted TIM-barrel fold metal-dependent hydrolase
MMLRITVRLAIQCAEEVQMIVDTHCHVSETWYLPVEDLLFQMDRAGVERAVLIQMRGEFNNDYQMGCLQRYPGRFASVVCVNTASADAPAHLRALAADGASGVRLGCNERSSEGDPLAVWRAAAEVGLTVSCSSGGRWNAEDVAAVVRELPDLRIVVEHLGGWNKPAQGAEGEAVHHAMVALASLPNIAIKIHGLGEFAQRAMPATQPFPFVRPLPPALDRAYAAFGPQRMMWGSDFPPVSSREGYLNALRFTQAELESKPADERERIFGGTAIEWFRFP